MLAATRTTAPGINAGALGFFLCSLCMHLAALWLLPHALPFELGAASGVLGTASTVTVRIIAEETTPYSASASASAGSEPSSESSSFADSKQASAVSLPEHEAASHRPHSAATQDYLPAGQLTRLPTPIADIDLNIAEIREIGFMGQTGLTLLIDADGTVTNVLGLPWTDNARDFAGRVAARFRSARFRPGEIDGKPVKSKLQITVVSEDLVPPDITHVD